MRPGEAFGTHLGAFRWCRGGSRHEVTHGNPLGASARATHPRVNQTLCFLSQMLLRVLRTRHFRHAVEPSSPNDGRRGSVTSIRDPVGCDAPNRTDLRGHHAEPTNSAAPTPDLALVRRTRPDDRPPPARGPEQSLRTQPLAVAAPAPACSRYRSDCSCSPAATCRSSNWVPDFNGDGQIDQARSTTSRPRSPQAVEGQRRAVQAHPFHCPCVRAHESGSSFAAQNPAAPAEAYQFLDGTWRNVGVPASRLRPSAHLRGMQGRRRPVALQQRRPFRLAWHRLLNRLT